MLAECSRAPRWPLAAAALLALVASSTVSVTGQQDPNPSRFRFKTGIDLVNISVTVTDRDGRFVPNLTPDDFAVYEDERPQPISHFANERVPVSLGLAVDTSGSMAGEKIASAREALRRFLEDLLGPEDEVFVYRFSERPELVQDWTADRALLTRRLGSLRPKGGTALYDTVAEAVPLAQSGQHRKKALVIISDGNDTNSSISVEEVRQQIRQSEVLVYGIGIDGEATSGWGRFPQQRPPVRLPFPWPWPGGNGRGPGRSPLPVPTTPGGSSNDDRVNEEALSEMTDDSGGRTEVIRRITDLDLTTAGIADELSRQYFIGYAAAAPKDGRWHSIRVEVRRRDVHVRARRGYVAS
jgi:VWFA-related protein